MAGVSLFWFYHILRSSGIWTDAGQHEIYLFDRKATGSFKNENEFFFISLIRVKPKKIFLRRNSDYLQTSWSAGKLKQYLYSFVMYSVKPLVKADIFRIPNFHLLSWNIALNIR